MLKWDAKTEDIGKHGKFENLWKGPFKIASLHGNNAYLLKDLTDELLGGGLVNASLLKHYLT